MKAFFSAATILAVSLCSSSAFAQFDDLFRGIERQIGREVQRQIPRIEREVQRQLPGIGREIVREVIQKQPPRHTYPVEPPRCEPPVRPIHPPVNPPGHCRIRPVVPAPVAVVEEKTPLEELPPVEVGQIVAIEGEFASQVGAVAVKIDSLLLEAEIVDRMENGVNAMIPQLPIVAATNAVVLVLTQSGDVLESLEVALVPASAPAPPEVPELPEVSSGQELSLEGDLGNQQGQVQIRIGSMNFPVPVVAWSAAETTIRLPQIKVLEGVEAELVILNAQGSPVDSINVMYIPEVKSVGQL